MIQKASYGQLVIGSFITTMYHSCVMSPAEFSDETSNHPGDLTPLQTRFGIWQLLALPKTEITFEEEEISDCQWHSGKYIGAADSNWDNCVKSQGAYWDIIFQCTMVLVSSSINVSIFHITWLIPSGQTSYNLNIIESLVATWHTHV